MLLPCVSHQALKLLHVLALLQELPAGEGRRMSMVPVGRPSAMGTQPSAAEMKRMSLAGATPSHVGAKRVAPAADGRAGGSKRGRY